MYFFYVIFGLNKHYYSLYTLQVVKLWDLESGNSIFEFGDAHGEHAITCMTFDTTGRR